MTNPTKIVVLGKKESGKTRFIDSLSGQPSSIKCVPTIEIKTSFKEIHLDRETFSFEFVEIGRYLSYIQITNSTKK